MRFHFTFDYQMLDAPDEKAVAPAHVQARREIEQGQGAALQTLQKLNQAKRLAELGLFVGMFLGGILIQLAAMNLLGAGLVQDGIQLLGVLVSAVGLNTFLMFEHEAIHGILFSHRWVNRWVAVALGAAMLIPFSGYRVLHLRHHKYLGSKGDPDEYRHYSDNVFLLWTRHYIRLAFAPALYPLLLPFLAYRHGSRIARWHILQEIGIYLILYTFLFGFLPLGLIWQLWLFPLLLAGYMTALRGLSQHAMTDMKDPYLASRTIVPSKVVQTMMIHENYHLEHHLFPEIPSYHLEEAHQLIWPRLPRVVTDTSYAGFLARFLAKSFQRVEEPLGLVIKK